MSLSRYPRALAEAALASRGARIRDINALPRFYRRHRWMFSSEEHSWVEAAVSVAGWDRIAYAILQERREAQGLPADRSRLSLHSSASGLGVRALLMPHYFLRAAFPRQSSRRARRR